MGEQAAPPSRRGSALTALVAVIGVAVVVAGGLITWIQLTAGAQNPPDPTAGLIGEEPPDELPGGLAPADVPAVVAAAVDEPLVGAVVLDALPEGTEGCGMGRPAVGQGEVAWAVVTPDGLLTGLLFDEDPWMMFEGERLLDEEPAEFGGVIDEVEGAGAAEPEVVDEGGAVPAEPEPEPPDSQDVRFLETCVLEWADSEWVVSGGSSGTTVPADGPLPEDGGMGSSCCDERGLSTAHARTVPPEGAAWALQERGAYWLAYPLADLDIVPLAWRFREPRFGAFDGPMRMPSTRVLFLADDGAVIDERFAGGW